MRTLFVSKPLHFAFLLLLFSLFSCQPKSEGGRESILPHDLRQDSSLTEQEAGQLASAKGKTAALIGSEDLQKMIRGDTSELLIVNFWKNDCQPCLQIQQNLQAIQQRTGENKFALLTLSLSDEDELEQVNLDLRRVGITSNTFLLKKENPDWPGIFSNDWDGSLPAFFVRTSDGYEQFYRREFSENELYALLQPFLL